MANREELALIRGARAGRAPAQLELGTLYLFGSAGLPKSLPTALHWLDRAAQQGCATACQLIGTHIPFDVAVQSQRPVACWFGQAFAEGNLRAGVVLAQLILGGHGGEVPGPERREQAFAALEAGAAGGLAEAQWLLAQHRRLTGTLAEAAAPAVGAAAATPMRAVPAPLAAAMAPRAADPRWLQRAADSGMPQAQLSQLDNDWEDGLMDAYASRALPLARALARQLGASARLGGQLSAADVTLLSRCARALAAGAVAGEGEGGADEAEIRHFFELAAAEHDAHAQMAVGLWCARMQVDGKRIVVGEGSANFKKAIRWLTLAGNQGLAEAWYALSRIYIKPEFSQRNVLDAQRYLERAAEMGYRDAQLECGNSAWRARRENESNDVRAVYWLQKAALQGCPQAAAALHKIAPRCEGAAYTETGALSAYGLGSTHPLLAARLELAALFGLTRAEALLLDVTAADQGHCLVVDIRGSYGRSKRRLVVIDSMHERHALDRIVCLFDGIDCGPGGPEGNYRQRLYRLKTLVPESESGHAEHGEVEAYEMAA
ncbi:tetratricopeptide repeat protein [Massilia pseudoviolaceinigra]|uniref:tetratricopeptide repeat protein n=1 Tax=Massilia pseudoviolaceinigra TaxID=3057165 RepID=UPI002796ABF2|nr:SEL1-like repeat protein [Massilia sp. CCM 9206]MDQ1921809.1 SEL1-like repeat protein [Massilia sp. CCM 9206]